MKMQVWQSALLAKIPGVVHGVSTRLGGVSRPPFATLNCSLQTGDRVEDVIENRRRLLTWLGFGLDAAVWGEQVHGTVVRQVTRRDAAEKGRSEEHTSELQSRENLVCRLLLEKK